MAITAPALAPAPAPAPLTRVEPNQRRQSGRDTGIDLVRACCVIGVVVLHAMMVGVTVVDGRPLFENVSDRTAWIAPVSWVLQVMPLFFVIGGFAGLLAYRRQRAQGWSAIAFVAGRLHRLMLPAVVTIGVVGAGLVLLAAAGVPADLVTMAGFRYGQPLWFLGVFLCCQALLPALAAAHDRAPLMTIGALATTAVLVDVLRAATGVDGFGFINLLFVWAALQQLGFSLADGTIDGSSRRTRVLVGVGAVVVLAVACAAGVYSADLVANINPPTTALFLVGIAHTAALSLFRARLARVSERPRVASFTAFVTRRTMTIYLWHMPVLLAMAGASAVFALATGFVLPAPDSAVWWLGRPLWVVAALGLTAAVAMVFSRIEAVPMPTATASPRRIVGATIVALLAVVLLLVVGTSALTAGAAVVLILVALRTASSSVRREAAMSPGRVRCDASGRRGSSR
ncbi:acyltransferase family protein [Plantibacter sp. RU18]|uniref:acyltransferase family protein n=1 Tax=Plantibacter sp. RU18 TaxID=3158143 RepID=UPI003D36B3EB